LINRVLIMKLSLSGSFFICQSSSLAWEQGSAEACVPASLDQNVNFET